MPKISDEQKQIKKDIIKQHAFNLFSQKGYSNTSIDDIVQAAGISKGGIYNYFQSKEEIFLAIAGDRFKKRHRFISNLSKTLSSTEKVKKYIHWALSGLLDDEVIKGGRFTFEFWSILSKNEELETELKRRYDLFYKDLASILEEGVKCKEFHQDLDIPSMCYIILSTMDGIAFYTSVLGLQITQEIIDHYTAMILNQIQRGNGNDML